jgi:hypothetical protein
VLLDTEINIMKRAIKVTLTGATGFVGEGVLLECLIHPQVEEVLVVSRKPYGLDHPKLKQCIVPDFMNLSYAAKEQLKGYDACFYCAGISSAGLNESTYTHITYDTTIHFADVLSELNPDMVFSFVSGKSTDSSENGKVMWARVKGKTENALKHFSFKEQYNFRPGFMKPTPGQGNVKTFYKVIGGIWPILFPKQSCLMKEVGLAMINAVLKGYPKQTLEISDIKKLARA